MAVGLELSAGYLRDLFLVFCIWGLYFHQRGASRALGGFILFERELEVSQKEEGATSLLTFDGCKRKGKGWDNNVQQCILTDAIR